jgi:hypothetical protein
MTIKTTTNANERSSDHEILEHHHLQDRLGLRARRPPELHDALGDHGARAHVDDSREKQRLDPRESERPSCQEADREVEQPIDGAGAEESAHIPHQPSHRDLEPQREEQEHDPQRAQELDRLGRLQQPAEQDSSNDVEGNHRQAQPHRHADGECQDPQQHREIDEVALHRRRAMRWEATASRP